MESAISVSMFQSTHPRGVRHMIFFGIHAYAGFNPRTRVGCDWAPGWGTSRRTRCFNPRTRVGCDVLTKIYESGGDPVSIHAPAWGATTRRPCPGVLVFHVSIHAPAWGATFPPFPAAALSAGFNPRTRVGCDSAPFRLPQPPREFQSTHPRGVRHLIFRLSPRRSRVSIHAPAWGATRWMLYALSGGTLFQSTHPRGVRPAGPQGAARCPQVSIHAPAWGATRTRGQSRVLEVGFQSTHPRGVRRRNGKAIQADFRFNPRTRVGCDGYWCERNPGSSSRFNPRTRVGCDENGESYYAMECPVSIHAPAWGATAVIMVARIGVIEFQSTHPRGVRLSVSIAAVRRLTVFQSTHPRGVRPNTSARDRVLVCFNPRTRVGCDAEDMGQAFGTSPFQSTHPRGVRRRGRRCRYFFRHVSIHAPAWGATVRTGRTVLALSMFQSTHPRGVRLRVSRLNRFRKLRFNPRTRVGCDCFHVLSSRFP